MIKPLAKYIVAVPQEAETKTVSGLYIPDSAQEKPKLATIVAVGSKVTELKTKDVIVYKSYSTTDIRLNSKEYMLIKEEDVLATIK